MKDGIPSIMIMENDPLLPCPKDPKLRCDCYKIDPCPGCSLDTHETEIEK